MNAVEFAQYGDRKLAHYNAWLLDPEREFGVPYPGFPEDLEIARVEVHTFKPKKAAVKRERAVGGETKLAKAQALFDASMSRDEVVALFMAELNMTKAGATTYYYNCKKG